MAEIADTPLESMSSTELKQLLREKTSELVTESPKETVEVTETPGEIVTEPTEEIPSERMETTEEPPETETKGKTVKLNVEGKEIEVPEDKLLDYAQQGYHYNQKMEALKKQRAELEKIKEPEKAATPSTQYTPAQIREELIRRLNENPEETLVQLTNAVIDARENVSKTERRQDLEFEVQKTESVPHWDQIKDRYKFFREMGDNREMAFLKADNDYFKTLYVSAKARGIEEGRKKTELKAKADIPGGQSKTRPPTTKEPSEEELAKMSSSELAKLLPKHTVADW